MTIVLPVTGSLDWDVTLNSALTTLDSAISALSSTSIGVGTAATGDLSGTYPGPTVSRINGVVLSVVPAAGNVLVATSPSAASWATPPASPPNGAAGGDLGSTYPNPTVTATHLAAALPVLQGGTGSTTQNFVDLTTVQTVAGNKTFSGQVFETSSSDRTAFSATYATTTNATNAAFNMNAVDATGRFLGAGVTGDTVQRFVVASDGGHAWGPGGSTARDVSLGRTATAQLGVTSGDLAIITAGKGLKVAEGTNAKMGIATLVAGTVTVSTTAVTANSRVFVTPNTVGGTQGFLHVVITAGTSFTITSSSGSDTSQVAWLIVDHT